jgi:arginine utilization protein RocB
MLELVAIPSVTGSKEENTCARFIHDRLSQGMYFRENPDDLRLVELNCDPLGRCFVAALLRAPNAKKTVVLTGHFDVVDSDVCGALRPWAFDPLEYTARIGGLALPEDARKDLDSGTYLFGRGVSDMKAGVALNICLFEEYATRREELEFNVLLLLVPDEEGDSVGMRGAISFLARLKEEEGLDLLVCVDTEPVFDARSPEIYYGTIGKIMPLYLCVGRESHAGEYYDGLNSTLVASFLNVALDGGKDTIETLGEQTFQPQCCLRMRDLRSRYAVTLPERTVLYYNCLTVERTPAAVLEDMKKRAMTAMNSALAHVGRSWTPRVLTVREALTKAAEAAGGEERLFAELLPRLSSTDERERNIDFLSQALDLVGEKGPLVVVGFVPPYYPPRVNRGEGGRERAVRLAAADAAKEFERWGFSLAEREVFQGITDLSFTGFSGEVEELTPLAANTPLWGRSYELPLTDLRKIDVPCVILGPLGKDAHKITERVEVGYTFIVLPVVLKRFIEAVFRHSSL